MICVRALLCVLFLLCSCVDVIHTKKDIAQADLKRYATLIRYINLASKTKDEIDAIFNNNKFDRYSFSDFGQVGASVLTILDSQTKEQYILIYTKDDAEQLKSIQGSGMVFHKELGLQINGQYSKMYEIIKRGLQNNVAPHSKAMIAGFGSGAVMAQLLAYNLVLDGFDPHYIELVSVGATAFADDASYAKIHNAIRNNVDIIAKYDQFPLTEIRGCSPRRMSLILNQTGVVSIAGVAKFEKKLLENSNQHTLDFYHDMLLFSKINAQ